MTSLYKRASPPQARVLRIIEGAIKNVAHKSGKEFDPRYARSVAKRACGTLMSQWAETLAATSAPSGWRVAATSDSGSLATVEHPAIRLASEQVAIPRKARKASVCSRPSSLRRLHKKIAIQMRDVKNTGNEERTKAFIDVLRMISEMEDDASHHSRS